MERVSGPPVAPVQNFPESELRNRFAPPNREDRPAAPNAGAARVEEAKSQEQLAEARVLSHSEQVVAQGRGLTSGTVMPEVPADVRPTEAPGRRMNNYLEARRQQGQASQEERAGRPGRPEHSGWQLAAVITSSVGTVVGIGVGIAVAVGADSPYGAVITGAFLVPSMAIAAALLYARR